MAVSVVTNAINYIGTSGDMKPTSGVPAGSVFHEANTSKKYIYDGSAWWLENRPREEEMNDALNALLVEARLLRLGLIDAFNCKEVDLIDVPQPQ